jgi:hypothetical protein
MGWIQGEVRLEYLTKLLGDLAFHMEACVIVVIRSDEKVDGPGFHRSVANRGRGY